MACKPNWSGSTKEFNTNNKIKLLNAKVDQLVDMLGKMVDNANLHHNDAVNLLKQYIED